MGIFSPTKQLIQKSIFARMTISQILILTFARMACDRCLERRVDAMVSKSDQLQEYQLVQKLLSRNTVVL